MSSKNSSKGMDESLFYEGHLSDEGQALAADALALDRTSDLPEALQDHLGHCQACREAVMELHRILSEDEALPEAEDHPFFRQAAAIRELRPESRFRWLKYAALILLLAVPGTLLILNSSAWTNASFSRWISGIFGKGSVDPFAAHAELEAMTGMVFRDRGLVVLLPLTGDTLMENREMEIQYQGLEDKVLEIKILDNQGDVKFNAGISGGSAALRLNLPPGRYYWKLNDGEEIVFLGVVFLIP